MPHLKCRAKAHFEIPTPEQRLVVHRIGKPDEHRREGPIGQHEAAFMILATGKDLDQLKCNSRLHNLENEAGVRSSPKIDLFRWNN